MSRVLWILIIALVALFGLSMLVRPKQAHSQATTITLDWTAPGDDGVVGTATTYKMRYSTVRPDTTSQTAMDSWWAAAVVVNTPPLPVPLIAGTKQTVVVPGTFISGSTYYFVMQACDEAPNCSAYSNVASKFIPDTLSPARIIDLKVTLFG